MVDHLAAENKLSHSALLAQILMFGLHDYAELCQLMARLTDRSHLRQEAE
jgi:hypothetical protein